MLIPRAVEITDYGNIDQFHAHHRLGEEGLMSQPGLDTITSNERISWRRGVEFEMRKWGKTWNTLEGLPRTEADAELNWSMACAHSWS